MKTLNKYIYESLLDDEDDLLKASGRAAEKYKTIGEKYKITAIEGQSLIKYMDVDIVKKYRMPWKQTQSQIISWQLKNGRHTRVKIGDTELLLCNAILGLNVDDLECALNKNGTIKKGEVYDFFHDIFQEYFDDNNIKIYCKRPMGPRIIQEHSLKLSVELENNKTLHVMFAMKNEDD